MPPVKPSSPSWFSEWNSLRWSTSCSCRPNTIHGCSHSGSGRDSFGPFRILIPRSQWWKLGHDGVLAGDFPHRSASAVKRFRSSSGGSTGRALIGVASINHEKADCSRENQPALIHWSRTVTVWILVPFLIVAPRPYSSLTENGVNSIETKSAR